MQFRKWFWVGMAGMLGIGLMGFTGERPRNPDKGKLTGKYFPDAAVFSEGKVCRVDSGAGTIIRFDQLHENPLFESKAPNMTHLVLWFKDGLMTGQRHQLPHPAIEVCYWEQGDLLMFHTTKGIGWIEFEANETGQTFKGRMEIKLVEPDHNMSNSDYHFMGGKFVAQYDELNEEN
jgi:hypothetical protein